MKKYVTLSHKKWMKLKYYIDQFTKGEKFKNNRQFLMIDMQFSVRSNRLCILFLGEQCEVFSEGLWVAKNFKPSQKIIYREKNK